MASDEDEELAALRASRRDRLGAAGLTRVRTDSRLLSIVGIVSNETELVLGSVAASIPSDAAHPTLSHHLPSLPLVQPSQTEQRRQIDNAIRCATAA